MKKFILFLKKIYLFVIFVALEAVAINYYANSTSYTRAKMLAATNVVVGGAYREFAKIGDYFGLREENDALTEQVARLNGELALYRKALEEAPGGYVQDSLARELVFSTATVISNTLTRPENFITIDKGRDDGVEPEMALVTPEGSIVGYVMECRDRTSVAISLLNTEFRTSGRIKGRDYLGSIMWDGRDQRHVTLSEIQKYAEISAGDTIVTDYSSRFPKDIMIGTVESYEMTEAGYFNVRVKLATKFSALRKVLLIRYFDIAERRELEGYNPENE